MPLVGRACASPSGCQLSAKETIIDFVIDTGADRTLIHGRDRWRFVAEPVRTASGLAARARVSGISGAAAPYAVEGAEYVFEEDDGALWPVAGDAHIALDTAPPGVPSLLGARRAEPGAVLHIRSRDHTGVVTKQRAGR